MAQTTFQGTRAELRSLLQQVAGIAAGRLRDPTGLAQALQLRIGVACLSQVQQDFVVKSRGGTGRDGIKWPPLKPATIAQRRTTAGERKAAGLTKANQFRGLLTASQDTRWRQIFGTRLAKLLATGVPIEAAKAIAARIAWATLKGEGAKTKLALFGGRQVDIGRDTGRMFRSLSPGVEDRPSGEAEQEFRVEPSKVIVGSNVPYFLPFHRKRPCWPAGGKIPAAWWVAIRAAAQRGLMLMAMALVTRSK